MTTQLVEKAEVLEQQLEDSGMGFDLPSAIVFAINEDDDRVSVTEVGASHDLYGMLESEDICRIARVSDYMALVSCGWAAPLDDETSPKQHAERRRVRLMVFANRDGMASVVRFQDDEEVVIDEGSAYGGLADAIREMYAWQED